MVRVAVESQESSLKFKVQFLIGTCARPSYHSHFKHKWMRAHCSGLITLWLTIHERLFFSLFHSPPSKNIPCQNMCYMKSSCIPSFKIRSFPLKLLMYI